MQCEQRSTNCCLCAHRAKPYLALSDASSAHDGGPVYVRKLDADAIVVPPAENPANEARRPSSFPAERRRRHCVLLGHTALPIYTSFGHRFSRVQQQQQLSSSPRQ